MIQIKRLETKERLRVSMVWGDEGSIRVAVNLLKAPVSASFGFRDPWFSAKLRGFGSWDVTPGPTYNPQQIPKSLTLQTPHYLGPRTRLRKGLADSALSLTNSEGAPAKCSYHLRLRLEDLKHHPSKIFLLTAEGTFSPKLKTEPRGSGGAARPHLPSLSIPNLGTAKTYFFVESLKLYSS